MLCSNECIRALHHHKNIVGLIGFSEEPYTIVLKRYDRSLFDAVLDRRLEINAQTTLFFCYCIADGMAEMHQLGMIHRDLKSGTLFTIFRGYAVFNILS